MATEAKVIKSVQCFDHKKTVVGKDHCKKGIGLNKINRVPIVLVKLEPLCYKAYEPILLIVLECFRGIDMRIRIWGGGMTSQIYAIRHSITKGLVAYYQKYIYEHSKKVPKDMFIRYDCTHLVTDPRCCDPKKFGGHGARGRFQKSYR